MIISFAIFDKRIVSKKLTLNSRVKKVVNLILTYVFGYLFYFNYFTRGALIYLKSCFYIFLYGI